MKEYDSVLAMKDYGKISIKLDKIMDAQNITRNKLASLTGVRFEVIDRLYRGNLERIDLDILARVCFVLKCEVKDILESVK